MKALLVIDMQEGGFKPGVHRHDAGNVIERINSLTTYFRNNGHKVIFIQHDGSRDGAYIPGSSDWQILADIKQADTDLYVNKTANDSFYHSKLHEMLALHGISDLYITGWATDYCVDSTIRSALHKDYNVTVIADAHTVGDRPHLPASQAVAYHNWLWAGMIPTHGSINVIHAADILKS